MHIPHPNPCVTKEKAHLETDLLLRLSIPRRQLLLVQRQQQLFLPGSFGGTRGHLLSEALQGTCMLGLQLRTREEVRIEHRKGLR